MTLGVLRGGGAESAGEEERRQGSRRAWKGCGVLDAALAEGSRALPLLVAGAGGLCGFGRGPYGQVREKQRLQT